jgi:glycosyltransferase involved in cell wall biosynthesis
VAETTIAQEIEHFGPTLIHAFHAHRVGPFALRLARRMEIPLVVTLTGTDVNHDLFDPERAPLVRHVLEGAASLVVFHDTMAARITAALPDLRGRLTTIAQAAVLPAPSSEGASRWAAPEELLFVLPAGIRAVKRPRLPLAPMDHLVLRHPKLSLLYAGPILDDDEGGKLLAALAGRPWARHVGAVPHAQMASLLSRADVVLNCSVSEGGMANSVLEAMSMGRAVLASDIEGNRSLIEDGVTGLLFENARDFERQAERLITEPELRHRLGTAGRARVEASYPPRREIEGYLELYRRLLPVVST